MESQLGDMTWSFANQGRRFQIWHFRLEILIPWAPVAPKFPNFAIQILLFRSKHTVAVVTHAHVLQNFHTTWVWGVACQKQRLGPKLEGAALGEHPKMWDPLRIYATVEASNFKFGTQIGFGTSWPKTTFWTKLAGVWARGAAKKNLGLPTYFCNRWSQQLQIWYTTWLWD